MIEAVVVAVVVCVALAIAAVAWGLEVFAYASVVLGSLPLRADPWACPLRLGDGSKITPDRPSWLRHPPAFASQISRPHLHLLRQMRQLGNLLDCRSIRFCHQNRSKR